MKVSDVINRIERIRVIVDVIGIEEFGRIDQNVLDDTIKLLDEYKDELLNKVVK